MFTWIFAVVLGSRNDLTVFHKSLNPEPALMMNIRFSDCAEKRNLIRVNLESLFPILYR